MGSKQRKNKPALYRCQMKIYLQHTIILPITHQFDILIINLHPTVCPSSIGPFYTVSYDINWVKTSRSYSRGSDILCSIHLLSWRLKVWQPCSEAHTHNLQHSHRNNLGYIWRIFVGTTLWFLVLLCPYAFLLFQN